MLTFDTLKLEYIDAIVSIEKEAFNDRAWSKSLFFDELNDKEKVYLVAFDKNEIIGYGGFAHIGDEAHIMNIAIAAKMRGKGYGTELTKALIQKALELNITAMTLEVSENNPIAIKMYERLNFALSGRRPNYYQKGEDALIFWLNFS